MNVAIFKYFYIRSETPLHHTTLKIPIKLKHGVQLFYTIPCMKIHNQF